MCAHASLHLQSTLVTSDGQKSASHFETGWPKSNEIFPGFSKGFSAKCPGFSRGFSSTFFTIQQTFEFLRQKCRTERCVFHFNANNVVHFDGTYLWVQILVYGKPALEHTFSGVGWNFRAFQGIFLGAKKVQGLSRFPGFVGHPVETSSIEWSFNNSEGISRLQEKGLSNAPVA